MVGLHGEEDRRQSQVPVAPQQWLHADQLLNSLLFTLFAFYGTYDAETLLSIFASSYVIYIFTSLLDTPALYLARRIKEGKAAT